MHKFRTILSVVATAAMVLGTMGAATASAASVTNETRADFIAQLDQSLGIQPVFPTSPDFSDVPTTNADYGYIEAAYQKGFINGISAGFFGPSLPITRAEAAKILVEAYEGGNYTPTQTSTTFTDNASIPTALVGYVAEAATLNLMLGFTSGAFGPEAYLTTAQEVHLVAQLKAAIAAAGFKVSASATDVGVGQIVTLSSTAVGSTTYAVTSSNSASALITGSSFVATAPGNYTVTGTSAGVTATVSISVYGAASGVTLTGPTTALVADGTSTETVTATVVDANGNTVANFSGTATVTVPNADASGTLPTSVTFASGVGTFTFTAPASAPASAVAITVSALTPTGGATLAGINYGTYTPSYAAAAAEAFGVTPAFNDVSANGNNGVQFTVTINNQAGNPMSSGFAYATLTLSGPGSFTQGGTPTTSENEYISANSGNGTNITVYAIQGETGTITLTASGAGLTTGTGTVQAVVTTAPSSFTISGKAETTSGGTPYELYTVNLVDANGNAVVPTNADNLTITDNTGTNGGTLEYYAVSNGAPTGSALVANGSGQYTSISISNSSGTAEFAVENTTAASTPATITVTDALTSTTKTASYAFQTGSAAWALFPGQTTASAATANYQVQAGQTLAFTAQLADANGNTLANSAQTVDFYFATDAAGATIDGSNAWTSGNAYMASSNASGQASVSVVVPSGASNTFELVAKVAGSNNLATVTAAVEPAVDYTTQLGLGSAVNTINGAVSLPSSMTAGDTLAGDNSVADVYVVPANAVGAYTTTTDTITVTSSNTNVLAISGASSGSETQLTSAALPTITAETAGTAVLTIKDNSNGSNATLTQTITVGAGAGAYLTVVNPDNSVNTAYTFAASGLSGPYTLEITDAGGNVVTATAPLTLTATQVETALGVNGVSGIVGIRTSSGGSDAATVTIAQGTPSVQVWIDGVTANNSTTENASGVALTSELPALSGASVTGSTLTLTFNNPLQTSATVAALEAAFTVSAGGSSDVVTGATVTGNTVTLTLTSPPAHLAAVTVSYAVTGGLQTGYGAVLAAFSNATVTNNN